MEVKPGYKRTEVGVIPEEWEVKKIGALAIIATGGTPSTEDPTNYGDDFPFVSPGDLGHSKYVSRTAKGLSAKGFAASRQFPAGSILFVCIGSTIGKCGVASRPLTSNQQINAILPTTAAAPDYLYYAVCATAGSVKALAGEQAVPIVNKSQFSATEIALPTTRREQGAISEAASDADALIESLDHLLAKKRQVKQGAMQELLTGKRRLPGFIGRWDECALGDLFDFFGGVSASRDQLSADGYAYLHYGDIHTSDATVVDARTYESLPKLAVPLAKVPSGALLEDGDLVFVDASEDEAGTSKHVLVSNPDRLPFISGLHTIVAKPRTGDIEKPYRRYCLQTEAAKRQFRFFCVGTKVSGISKANLARVRITAPGRPEQRAIASVLSDMDAEIDALEAKLAKARQIKQGMMQELLTGRIRLV